GAYGTVTFTSTNVTYHENGTPATSDSFTYLVTGPHGGTSTGTVFMTIVFTNEIPVAGNDFVTIYSGQTVSIPVLTNDYDLDGDTLQIVNASQGTYGSVTFGPTNVT